MAGVLEFRAYLEEEKTHRYEERGHREEINVETKAGTRVKHLLAKAHQELSTTTISSKEA